MDSKECKRCKEIKPVNGFRQYKNGYSPTCKSCYRQYNGRKEYQSIYDKKRWLENKEYEKERVSIYRKTVGKFKEREKMKNDPIYFLKVKIKWSIKSAFKRNGYTKNSRTYEILGLDYNRFKEYIESKFTEGMTWQNHGEWHLDHKIPISFANNEMDIIKLNHYTNFQPLWAKDNLSKGNKYADI